MDPIIFTTTIFQVYALHYILEVLGGMGGGRVGKIGGTKVIMQGNLFQRCTQILYCSVNTRH